jgi:hypothetical protein
MQEKYYRQKQQIQAVSTIWRDARPHCDISACLILATEQYVKSYDVVCAQLQFNVCQEMGVKLKKERLYEHIPKSVETSHEVR